MTDRARLAVVGLAVAALLTGCTTVSRVPTTPTTTPVPVRDLTIATTEKALTDDPVAAVDTMSVSVVLATYQRLMTADEGDAALHGDAATDCKFTEPTVYECALRTDLVFPNGNKLTSSDVAFSIHRALRLGAADTSAVQLAALDTIETPDDLTVRFLLKWSDHEFGFALASPAASIVDEQTYDPDAARGLDLPSEGSGPLQLLSATDAGLAFTRHEAYDGPHAAMEASLLVRYFADSAAVEQAMTNHEVDMVWRGLNAAALQRLNDQITASSTKTTTAGFTRRTLKGVRVHLLTWQAASPWRLDATMRTNVSNALQDQRTLASIIPAGIEGSTPSFTLGGAGTITPLPGERPRLTLGYTSSIAGEREIAGDLRDRLEEVMAVSVTLVPDSADVDLRLLNYRAWTATPFAWLQPYQQVGLPGSAAKVEQLEQIARTTSDASQRATVLAEIQMQAAADAVTLPVSQLDDDVFVSSTVRTSEPMFGPGWQLGLWAVGRG